MWSGNYQMIQLVDDVAVLQIIKTKKNRVVKWWSKETHFSSIMTKFNQYVVDKFMDLYGGSVIIASYR